MLWRLWCCVYDSLCCGEFVTVLWCECVCCVCLCVCFLIVCFCLFLCLNVNVWCMFVCGVVCLCAF